MLASNERVPGLGVLTFGPDQAFLVVELNGLLVDADIVDELVSQMSASSNQKYGEQYEQSGANGHAQDYGDERNVVRLLVQFDAMILPIRKRANTIKEFYFFFFSQNTKTKSCD